MQLLNFKKKGLYLTFGITEDNRLLIHDLCDTAHFDQVPENNYFTPVELHTTGANPDAHHGAKHVGSDDLFYDSHTETDSEVCLVLKNERVSVKLVYEFFENTKTVRAHTEIKNICDENIGIEYISSFCLYGIKPETIYIPHNGWCREVNWKAYTPDELGYSKINRVSTKRIAVSNTGTWSTKEHLPMGIIREKERMLFWQIEHNGSWNWEISDASDVIYLKLSGPSEQENGWWKELKPQESFASVSVAVSVCAGDFSDVLAEMMRYRRIIAHRCPADLNLPVIFNDYMGCLWADPTTEKSLPVIDAAAEMGAEIYCMDAGWYADGTWWETVGEWEVCEKRFRNGMKEVFDYIRAKGMIGGIWLEPEVIGILCPILDRFDDDCFFMRHGRRVIDHGRYQFDFRNKKVTDFLDSVVDRLVAEYGIGYFKFDYNIDGGMGTEVDADSFGDGLMQHNAAYLKWVDGIYARHPQLIIENCASGGMRMDYKTLSHFSLQSITDAMCYKDTAPIAAMSQTAVLPEQAAVWSIPKKEDTPGEVAINMVNAMFKRLHLSGETPWLCEEKRAIVKEGVEFYKSIRCLIPESTAFYPLGIADFGSEWVVCGICTGENKYLSIVNLGDAGVVKIPLQCSAEQVYPKNIRADIHADADGLSVGLSGKSAVILKLK